jgi:diguanylate cyclase (GGDEF)-like protein/PAS domain S-box-containing protein
VRAFAREWAVAIAGTSFVPMSSAEVEGVLYGLTGALADTLLTEPFDPTGGTAVGADLVRQHFTDGETLGRTVTIMADRLVPLVAPQLPSEVARPRVTALQGAIAAGFARAAWLRTLDEQEQVRGAYLLAKADAVQAMRASEARFRAVFAGAAIGIGITDVSGTILEINTLMAEMMGMHPADLAGQNLRAILDSEDQATLESVASGGRENMRFEKYYLRPDGSPLWTDLTLSLIRDGEGRPRYILAMGRDVTQEYLLAQRMQHQATHDPLTNLPNRTLFFDWLDEIFRSDRDRRVGLCYLDLDGFKMVNDTLGHDAGDHLLAMVAARLADCVSRLGHRVARMGGDEFVLLVTDSPGLSAVTALADAVLETLRTPFTIGAHHFAVSASIGIVERPVRGTTMAELMKAADVTLYWAKSDGKARWALFDPDRNARQLARYALSAAMPGALERGEFFLDYQPLVRLSDSSLVGVEALVRWRHPQLGRLGPGSFIELAEETGLIVPLGAWVLREACQQAQQWQADGPIFMSVNLAVRQAQSPGIVDEVARILDETGLPPAMLQLELTESDVMGPANEPLDALQRLSDMGIRIAIDDFGTGYSNLAYLRRLPVHSLKLAGSFVDGLRRADPVDQEIVATLVGMAHTLELSVTAEGIEVAAQAERLRDLGCDWGQGYFFARPSAPNRIGRLLDGHGGSFRLPHQRRAVVHPG